MSDDRLDRLSRIRRAPPPLLPVEVVERREVSPRLLRLTFAGEGLAEMHDRSPAASVRLLVPSPGDDELVMPAWDGNEFLLPSGNRPILRTFTPLRTEGDPSAIDLAVVRHPGGAVSSWAERVTPGGPAAISGPGTGFEIPGDATELLVLGDETALPAATQLLAAAPDDVVVTAHLEIIRADAQIDLSMRADDSIEWHVTGPGQVPGRRLVDVVTSLDELADGTHVWAAGEASAMQAIRGHLFDVLDVGRRRATVRGYWKPARA